MKNMNIKIVFQGDCLKSKNPLIFGIQKLIEVKFKIFFLWCKCEAFIEVQSY